MIFGSAEHKLHCFYNGYIEVADCDAQTRVTNYLKALVQVKNYTGEFMSGLGLTLLKQSRGLIERGVVSQIKLLVTVF